MKTKTTIPWAVALLWLSCLPLWAATVNIFTTSALKPNGKAPLFKEIGMFVLKEIRPGDSVRVFCGNTMAPIAEFKCPSGRFYENNPTERAKAMAPAFADFKKWVLLQPDTTKVRMSLDIPRVVRFLIRNTPRDASGETLLLVGSPILSLAAHPDHAMSSEEGKFYPSDGFLASPDPVYGTQTGETDSLAGVKVRMAYLGDPFRGDKDWKTSVERWWHLYTKHRGASLVGAEASLTTVLNQIRTDHRKPVSEALGNMDVPSAMVESSSYAVATVSDDQIKKFTEPKVHVYLCDGSTSMRNLRHKIADELATRPIDGQTIHQIYAFYDYDRLDRSVPVSHLIAESKDPAKLGAAFRALTFIGGQTNPEAGNEGIICAQENLLKRGLKAKSYELFSDHRPLEANEHPSDRRSFRELVTELMEDDIPFTYHWMGAGEIDFTPPTGVVMKRM